MMKTPRALFSEAFASDSKSWTPITLPQRAPMSRTARFLPSTSLNTRGTRIKLRTTSRAHSTGTTNCMS